MPRVSTRWPSGTMPGSSAIGPDYSRHRADRTAAARLHRPSTRLHRLPRMPLQGDQRALLQLLVERGQSYEDIAGLLGGSADDVRERARAALTEIGGADPDTDVALTDFLLGQADPIGRADAIRHLQADPGALDLAKRIQTGLAVIAPDAVQPSLPEPRGSAARPPCPTPPPLRLRSRHRRRTPRRTRPRPRRRTLIAGLGAVGLLLVVGILAVAGVFDGSGSRVRRARLPPARRRAPRATSRRCR